MHVFLFILGVAMGYLLDEWHETASLVWFASFGGVVSKDVWPIFYPLYLFSRGQCYTLYFMIPALPTLSGLSLLLYINHSLLVHVLASSTNSKIWLGEFFAQ